LHVDGVGDSSKSLVDMYMSAFALAFFNTHKPNYLFIWDLKKIAIVCLLEFPFIGKDIVFRFIIEYGSLRYLGPLGNNNNRSIFI
jgi:hypothetical protein